MSVLGRVLLPHERAGYAPARLLVFGTIIRPRTDQLVETWMEFFQVYFRDLDCPLVKSGNLKSILNREVEEYAASEGERGMWRHGI